MLIMVSISLLYLCQYLGDLDGCAVDVGEMALALQEEYSDYARKKKVAFKNLVAKGKIPLQFMVCVQFSR